MSKKSFLSSMEDLFEGMETVSVAPPPKVQVLEKSKPASRPKKKLSGLDALFSEAFEEGMQRPKRKRKPLPKSGLNSLIRSTVESGRMEVDYEARKRVTFLFEKDKLEKLKAIAREEQQQLKEVISRIVSDYLEGQDEK